MKPCDAIEPHHRAIPVDGVLLRLSPEEEAFFKTETGIKDTDELRRHIITVHEEAYKIFPYPCIRGFASIMLQASSAPAYPRALGLVDSRPGAIFLDIGCCLGTDVRKAIHDGWPMSQTIGTNYEAGFWELGHRLFRTTPETYPAKFLAWDVFDDANLSPSAPSPSGPPPPVGQANSLTELRGHISAIHASSFFHLFDEEGQLEAGKRLARLLDPRPGSIIFGSHGANPVKGRCEEVYTKMFCHSPESWTQMWEEQIFEKGQVKVDTVLKGLDVSAEGRAVLLRGGDRVKSYWLTWSVERL